MTDPGTALETADRITLHAHIPAKHLGEFRKLRTAVNKRKWREKEPHTWLCTTMDIVQRSWELGYWIKVGFEYLESGWDLSDSETLHAFREADFNEWSFEEDPPRPYPTALVQQIRANEQIQKK